jgi:hypothetical protein
VLLRREVERVDGADLAAVVIAALGIAVAVALLVLFDVPLGA